MESPFTLKGWITCVISFYIAAYVLWFTNFNFDSFFWLFTVLLEQNDDGRSKAHKSCLFLILAWLYAALVLRQAYTSNMYDYMTFEKPPSGLPESFKEILLSESTVVLSSVNAIISVDEFERGIDLHDTVNRSNAKYLTRLIFKKFWYMQSFIYPGPFSNLRTNINGNVEICNLEDPVAGNIIENTCVKMDTFAYMAVSGPTSLYKEMFPFYTGKLLLTLNNIGLNMFENNGDSILQNADFIVAISENFLKLKYEKYLASFLQAWLDLL